MKKSKWILIVYIAAITIFTVIRCMLPGEQKEERVSFGVQATREYELYGDRTLKLEFECLKEKMSGITFGYSDNGVIFEEETIGIKIYTGNRELKLIQDETVRLDAQVDGTEIYVQIRNPIPVGDKVTVVVTGTGTEEGPVFKISDGASNYSTLYVDGVMKANRHLVASAFYDYETMNYDKIVIDYAVLFLAGAIIYLIHRKSGISFRSLKMDLWHNKKERGKDKIRLAGILKKISKKKKLIAGYLLLVAGMFLLLDYTYYYAVKDAANESTAKALSKVRESDPIYYMREGVPVSVTFRAEENNLSGMAFAIEYAEDAAGTIKLTACEGKGGENLFEAYYAVADLMEKAEEKQPGTQDKNSNLIENGSWLEFPQILGSSKQKEYTVTLEMSGADGKALGYYYKENGSGKGMNVVINGEMTAILLGMSGLYKENLFLKSMYLALGLMLCAFISILYYLIFVKKAKFCNCFLVGMLFLGLIYTLVITAYAVPDEPSHIDTAYRVSNQLMGIEYAKGPNRSYKRISDIDVTAMDNVNINVDSYRQLYEELFSRCRDERLETTYSYNNLSNATRLNYLPAAVGFTAARLLHLGYLPMILFGRLCNFVVAALFMYFGIRKMPFGKTVFAIVGLLPITLQQIISCSYDPVLIGCAYMFTGYCFYLAYSDEKIYLNDILVLMFSGALISACKGGVYLPLVFLILLIPFKRKAFNRKWMPVIGMLCMCALLVFGRQFASKIFGVITAAQGTVFGRVEQVELYSASYFIHQPMELIRVFENSFTLLSDHYLTTLIGGLLGWLNIQLPWVIVLGFCILIFMSSLRGKDDIQYVQLPDKGWLTLISAGCLLLVMLSMLVSWTPMGNEAILGVQGRYFTPFICIWLCTIRNSKLVYRKKNPGVFLFGACVLQIIVVGRILMAVL